MLSFQKWFQQKLQQIQASYTNLSTELGHQMASASSEMHNSHMYGHVVTNYESAEEELG